MHKSATQQAGLSLVELLVSLAIGSFLIIGALTVYTQNRATYISNEQLARVQENAQFALDVIEPHIRLSSYWGQTSRWGDIAGARTDADPNPSGLITPAGNCGPGWAWDLERSVEGENNGYTLGCAPTHPAQNNSDVLITRHASVDTAAPTPGRLQIRSSRVNGVLFDDGNEPVLGGGIAEATFDVSVNAFYVAQRSDLFPNYPSLRRKVLRDVGGAPVIEDEEVAPGVENMQIQFGLDTDGDNSVDRYVDPDSALIDPADPGFIAGTRVLTARIWLLVRAQAQETGVADNRNFTFGDVDLGVFNDRFRRLLVSKTILLHNARL
ncbi:MAG: PilW family protein [Pseudomonadota bacterium]